MSTPHPSSYAVATPASEFRRLSREGQAVTLPESGFTAIARSVSLQSLVVRGLVPSELFVEAMKGFPDMETLADSGKPDDMGKLAELLINVEEWQFAILKEMLLSPKMVKTDPVDDEIAYDDLAEGDKHFLMQLAQLPIKQWKTFLSGQVPSVPTLVNEPELQNEAE